MTTAAQLKAIHAIRRRSGMTEPDYRALLVAETGKASSKDLSTPVAAAFIDKLQGVAGGRPAAARATGPYAAKLQALWLSAWNLAIVRSKDDRALLAYVRRQTKVTHTRFLTDPAVATKAIQGLKDWIARDGGVEWPASDDILALKQAVVRAIAAKLQSLGNFTSFVAGRDVWPVDVETYAYRRGLPAGFCYYDAGHWDKLANMLGARLRGHLAAQARSGSAS